MSIVQTMSVRQLQRELRLMKDFEPQAGWVLKRIADIEAELRARSSFHY